MFIKQLLETSENNWQGSLTADLIASKIWICNILKSKNQTTFSTIYILGSWYGNMGYILKRCGIKFDKIVNVDKNRNHIEFSKLLYKKLQIHSEHVWADANNINFDQVDNNSIIINTSVQDMNGNRWYKSIPEKLLIAIQSRNAADIGHETLVDFNQEFPMDKILYINEKQLRDPETEYLRFMKIGIK